MTKLENFRAKFQKFDFNRVIVILSILIVIVAVYRNKVKADKLEEVMTLNEALNDTVVFWKTEEGYHKARIAVLEAENPRDFVNFKTRDTTVNRLQKLVKENQKYLKNRGSATVMTSETKIDTTTKTIVNNNLQAAPNGKSPIYTTPIKMGQWVTGTSIATRDSTYLQLTFKEEMDIIIGREKTGFLGLGKGKTFTEATLHNPYSEIKTIRTYQTTAPKEKKISVGPTLMYGIGQGFKPGVYIGIGATWGVIKF